MPGGNKHTRSVHVADNTQLQPTIAVVTVSVVAEFAVAPEGSGCVDTHRVRPTVVLVPRTLVDI